MRVCIACTSLIRKTPSFHSSALLWKAIFFRAAQSRWHIYKQIRQQTASDPKIFRSPHRRAAGALWNSSFSAVGDSLYSKASFLFYCFIPVYSAESLCGRKPSKALHLCVFLFSCLLYCSNTTKNIKTARIQKACCRKKASVLADAFGVWCTQKPAIRQNCWFLHTLPPKQSGKNCAAPPSGSSWCGAGKLSAGT